MAILLVTVIAVCTALADYKWFYKEKNAKALAQTIIRHILLVNLLSHSVTRFVFHYDHFVTTDAYTVKQYLLLAGIAVVIGIAVAAIFKFFRAHNVYSKENEKRPKAAKALKIISFIIAFFGCIVVFGVHFVSFEWSSVSTEQFIVNMFSPTKGTELGIYIDFVEVPLFRSCLVLSLFGYFVFPFYDFALNIKGEEKVILADKIRRLLAFVLAVLFLAYGCYSFNKSFSFKSLYLIYGQKSDFIEQNYADPKTTKIEFPAKKRNLIFFYLESMENSYLDESLGGYMKENLMPELTALSHEGVMFSNTASEFGGPIEAVGTSWSLASMVNQNLGIPMKPPTSMSAYATDNHFIAGATGLGDILKEQGYNQEIMIGSDAGFGGLDYLYHTHGDYKVFDYNYAINNGYIPEDYKVWWGFEDEKLYTYAKEEITALYEQGKPFNFTLENANTHMPDGYLPPDAPKPYDSPYANAINYSQKEVVEFIKWIQAQPFYKNTTIVLIGDHRSMDKKFFKEFDKNYIRTQYHLILNPDPSLANTAAERFVNRRYCNVDMFPTTLAAMGCKIEGDRLAVGTNLFSDKKTLIEEYGLEYVDDEFLKGSTFYQEVLCEEKK
ncbi:MAG: sulfatase-like hydrolase/transferase [Clostridia bacterium]|nr:sulfatase-like hydrolase/transferase [Clostridia bacterium]